VLDGLAGERVEAAPEEVAPVPRRDDDVDPDAYEAASETM